MAVLIAVGIYTGKHGQGRYQWNVPLANMLKLLKIEAIFFAHRRDHITYKVVWALTWANLLFLYLPSCLYSHTFPEQNLEPEHRRQVYKHTFNLHSCWRDQLDIRLGYPCSSHCYHLETKNNISD
ncbi:uncharacterized protein F4817DRAFT_330660 [Daldinia loculata]|uniref:uncharacterized protein n=1 Tax=Daldinia loculata TaxID=103429 RepID=UPI0020C4AE7B|nr:uncharacterized protein F4817DRAFT_330660 [Daldinia loculata]KAI1649539.1 hypothetical protein F4817DRAFT_330660 [Daldinia loculata]